MASADTRRARRRPRTRSSPAPGMVGRLARGGNIPLGYYNDPEKTAETFVTDAQGRRWSIPGDFALLEADGRITLLGRGSVSINSGGEKIYPEEVEGALKSHPDVFDVLVVGVPDERWGERVTALLQPRPGQTPTLEELQEHCRGPHRGLQGPARAAARRRGAAPAERQARLPRGQGTGASARGRLSALSRARSCADGDRSEACSSRRLDDRSVPRRDDFRRSHRIRRARRRRSSSSRALPSAIASSAIAPLPPARRRHDAHAGDGAEPAQRRPARALVQLGAARHAARTSPSLAQQRHARSRRSSSTRARSKACAATSRSCSRCSRPAGSASRARRSRPTRNNFARHQRVRRPRGPARTCRRTVDPSPSRVLPDAAARRARADPAAAQLRRPATAKRCRTACISAPSDRVGRRADLGVLRRQQLPVRQAHLGAARRLRHPHPPAVLGRRSSFNGVTRRVRAVRARATTRRTRAPATGWRPSDSRRVLVRHRARSTATRATLHLNQPLIGGEVALRRQRATGCSARDGGIFSFGDAQFYGSTGGRAPEPADQRHGAHRQQHGLLARRRTTAASSRSATRSSTARRAACTSTSRCSAWSAPRRARATGCSPATAASSASATRKFYGSLGGAAPRRRRSSRCSARRPATATGC